MDGKLTNISHDQLEQLLSEAACKGARAALKEIGLADEHAGADVRQLRDLLSAWRQVRKGALQQVGKLVIGGLLLGLVYLAGRHGPTPFN